jgi:hypothetical protein
MRAHPIFPIPPSIFLNRPSGPIFPILTPIFRIRIRRFGVFLLPPNPAAANFRRPGLADLQLDPSTPAA